MKHLTASILGSLLIITNLSAKNIDNKVNITNLEQFYYQKGYNDAKKEAYAKGYRDAIKDALKILYKYKNKMEAIESGKYLLKEGKITYPQVFKIRKPDGSYQIVITKPLVEEKLNVNDLVKIPTLNQNYNISLDLTDSSSEIIEKSNLSDYPNSFHLQNEKYYVKTPFKRAKSLNYETCLTFPKLPKVKKILIASGKPFVEEKDGYKIYFNNPKEKISFCKNIGGELCKLAK